MGASSNVLNKTVDDADLRTIMPWGVTSRLKTGQARLIPKLVVKLAKNQSTFRVTGVFLESLH